MKNYHVLVFFVTSYIFHRLDILFFILLDADDLISLNRCRVIDSVYNFSDLSKKINKGLRLCYRD